MKAKLGSALSLWISCFVMAVFSPADHALAAEPVTIRVLSDRTQSHLKPLFDQFESASGIKISAVFVDQGLINRLETRPSEADVVITKDAELLELARQKKLLQPFKSEKITSAIPAEFRDPKNAYFVDAHRARAIFYSKARVKPEQLSDYEDLASPKWKKKLCMRSGYHEYNIALFGQMMAAYGPEKTKKIIQGLHANLAREPQGGDRDQAKAIVEGKCDVALMNSYYHPIMLANPEQKAWAEATAVHYPDQKGKGSFIMRSGLALTKAGKHVKEATTLLQFFASTQGQNMIASITHQFPTNKAVPAGERFKINFVPLNDAVTNRENVVKLLNEINFDKL